jgi:tRNA(Ile)-lysidine synthase
VRRHRGVLHLTPHPLPPVPPSRLTWRPGADLVLPCGRLHGGRAVDGELDAARLDHAGTIAVDFRRGGENCRPDGREHRHALKKLFQEWGVPPWERERTPLLFVDGELAAVPGYCVCTGFAARAGQAAYRLVWTSA